MKVASCCWGGASAARRVPFLAYPGECAESLPEKVLDALERFFRLCLKAENQRRRVRRCAYEPPAVADIHARAVYINNAISVGLELGAQFLDNPILIFVGGLYLDGGRRNIVWSFCDNLRQRLVLH